MYKNNYFQYKMVWPHLVTPGTSISLLLYRAKATCRYQARSHPDRYTEKGTLNIRDRKLNSACYIGDLVKPRVFIQR